MAKRSGSKKAEVISLEAARVERALSQLPAEIRRRLIELIETVAFSPRIQFPDGDDLDSA